MVWLGVVLVALLSAVIIFNTSLLYPTPDTTNSAARPDPFPLSVFPREEVIIVDERLESFVNTELAEAANTAPRLSWLGRVFGSLATRPWYQNLASPSSRTLIIWAGDRHEEVAGNFAAILGWDDAETEQFIDAITTQPPLLPEGTFQPGRYVVPTGADPHLVARAVTERFDQVVLSRYPDSHQATIALADTLIIAALLEREAYTFADMRIISGVIWNRLFADMRLQIDATLQYARGTDTRWWPVPQPRDKFVDSSFNTYQIYGLPPAPIANPSVAAVVAALNPEPTDCYFYFHTNNGQLHCSENYEAHVALLRQHFGQGQ